MHAVCAVWTIYKSCSRMALMIPSFAWYPVIFHSPGRPSQRWISVRFQSFLSFCFFPGYLRISDCFCWTDWQNGWCFELCIQFLAFFLVSQSGQPLGPLPSSWCPMETWQNRFGSPSTSAGHLLAKVWGCGSVHRPIHPTGKAWKTKLHATRRFCRKLEDRPIDFWDLGPTFGKKEFFFRLLFFFSICLSWQL